MARQTIGIGSAPGDGTGDTLRNSFDKTNDNFAELYARIAELEGSPETTVIDLGAEGVAAGNSGAANFAIIEAVVADLIAADDEARYEFHWPTGTIQVSDPRGFALLFWQKHVAHASGTALKSTHASFTFPFVLGDVLTTDSLTSSAAIPYTSIMGSKFNSAAAGATSITCTTAADAASFPTGMRVLLHGYDQQRGDGYPPNPRYFEWKTVAANGGNGTTGVVPFTEPLDWAYDDEWFEFSPHGTLSSGITFGKPRILSLDRGVNGFFPTYVEFEGDFTLSAHQAQPANSGTWLVPGDETVLDGMTFEDNVWPSVNRSFTCTNFAVGADLQPDKICGTGVFEDFAVVGDLSEGTSFHSLEFRRGTVGDDCIAWAKETLFENISIDGNFGAAGISTPSVITINGLVFTGSDHDRVTEPEFRTLTIEAVDGNDLVFADDGTEAESSTGIFIQAKEGTWVWKEDGSKYGKIGRIGIEDGAGNWRVEWESYVGSAPVAAETWKYDSARIIDLGGHTHTGRMWHVNTARFANRVEPINGAWETTWTQADMSFTANREVWFYGRIDKITVNVTTPYTGSDANHHIYLVPIDDGSPLIFNAKVAGQRVVDRVAATITGTQSGDDLDLVDINTWCTKMNTRMRNGVAGFPTDLDPPAAFTITIRWKDVSQL